MAQADTLRVDASVGPFYSVQAALDAASDGDTVLIAPGTYHEHLMVHDLEVSVVGQTDARAVILDAAGLGRPVTILGAGQRVAVSTLTLRGGVADTGGGLHAEGVHLELRGVVVEDNEAELEGGGVWVTGGSLSMQASVVSGNLAALGGGVVVLDVSDLRIQGCEVSFNRGYFGSGLRIEQSAGLVAGNLFLSNGRTPAGEPIKGATSVHVENRISTPLDLINNTFVNSGCCNLSLSGPQLGVVLNNSFSDAAGYGVYLFSRAPDSWPAQHLRFNNFFNNDYADFRENVSETDAMELMMTGRAGNLSEAPAFVQPELDGGVPPDFRLLPSSALIDAGSPDVRLKDTDGTRADIGAYGGPWLP